MDFYNGMIGVLSLACHLCPNVFVLILNLIFKTFYQFKLILFTNIFNNFNIF